MTVEQVGEEDGSLWGGSLCGGDARAHEESGRDQAWAGHGGEVDEGGHEEGEGWEGEWGGERELVTWSACWQGTGWRGWA